MLSHPLARQSRGAQHGAPEDSLRVVDSPAATQTPPVVATPNASTLSERRGS
jgi:hypothetical protein